MTRDKTDVSLREMLDYSREALSFVENVEFQQFESDRMRSLAVVRLVEIIGEVAIEFLPMYRVNIRNFPGAKLSTCAMSSPTGTTYWTMKCYGKSWSTIYLG